MSKLLSIFRLHTAKNGIFCFLNIPHTHEKRAIEELFIRTATDKSCSEIMWFAQPLFQEVHCAGQSQEPGCLSECRGEGSLQPGSKEETVVREAGTEGGPRALRDPQVAVDRARKGGLAGWNLACGGAVEGRADSATSSQLHGKLRNTLEPELPSR